MAEVRTTGDVWLRTGPGLDYDSVAILKTGRSYEYLGESSVDGRGVAWYRISAGEKEGWVSSRYTELIGESANAEDEAEAAEAVETSHSPLDDLQEKLRSLADRLSQKEVVIATETGCGVIPLDPRERRNREAAGRLSCLLAERAETVVRICCGIPQVLK